MKRSRTDAPGPTVPVCTWRINRDSRSPASSSNQDPVKNVVLQEANLDSSDLTITSTWAPDNNPGSVVKVQVQYKFKPVSLFLPAPTLSLSATSQMVIMH